MPYVVRVADMHHYMDPDEQYDLPPFATLAEAELAARAKVDGELAHMTRPKLTAEELVKLWMSFGSDPYILATEGEPGSMFSAAAYVKQRAPYHTRRIAGSCPGWFAVGTDSSRT